MFSKPSEVVAGPRNWLASTAAISSTYFFIFFFQGELLLFDDLKLVTEVEFGGLLLKLGEFVFVFGHLLEGWLNATPNEFN